MWSHRCGSAEHRRWFGEGAEPDEAFEATKQLNYDDHLAQQAEEDGAIWYVAVGQERVGPIAADAVQAYIDQGQVTDASFVWAEGMDDWSPLGEVPALSRLLPLGDEGQNLLAEEPSDEATSAVAPPSPFQIQAMCPQRMILRGQPTCSYRTMRKRPLMSRVTHQL